MPDNFESLQQYVSIFEPLLLEEARESVKKEFQEAANAGGAQCSRHHAGVPWHIGTLLTIELARTMQMMMLRSACIMLSCTHATASSRLEICRCALLACRQGVGSAGAGGAA